MVAAVTWLERVPPEAGDVRVRRVTAEGALGSARTLATTAASRPAGFPKLVRHGANLLAAWTVPGDTMRVRLTSLPMSALK
ncbi:MAG: hypothetical protein H7066_21890 [Cytophagaceae bacterium]|nr:hypothetical protein [Gemmatimonadaceae bacterium]